MAKNIDTCRCSWVDRRICSCRHGSRLVDSRLIDSRLVDSRVVGGILLGSHLDWRSLIWSRFWKWGDERQRLSHRACQKFVHTNFVSLQLNENLYNKLQYFWLLQGCGFNLWMFFTTNVLWFFTSRTLMQGLWLDLARTIFNCFESLTASILQAWELLTAWILAQLLGFFFTWRD